MRLKCDIRQECTKEIKTALQSNIDALQSNISDHEKKINDFIDQSDQSMKQINDMIQKHLLSFNESKRKFFQFDGVKMVLFWVGQIMSVFTLVLLVYFLFGVGA